MTEADDKEIQARRERFGFKRPASRIRKESVDAGLSHQYVLLCTWQPEGPQALHVDGDPTFGRSCTERGCQYLS